jgi:hypothetical protein
MSHGPMFACGTLRTWIHELTMSAYGCKAVSPEPLSDVAY